MSDMQYRPFGPVESIGFDNGQTLTKVWDQNYWPDAVNSPAFSYDFTTDSVGNIIRIDSSTDPTRSYGYDRLDRLNEVRAANQSLIESYSYDATGNRISRTSGGATEAYGYANTPMAPVLPGSPGYGDYSHRLQSVGTTPRTYDEVGNTLTGIPALNAQGVQAEYDVRNRITGLRMAANSYIARYEYNGRGERVAKNVGTDALLYLYDESGQLLGRYATNTNPGNTFALDEELVWLDNMPVASFRVENGSPVVRGVLTDHLNTPRALTALHGGNQSAGTIVWRWSLTSRDASGNNAFGTNSADEDPDGNGAATLFDLRFPGQQYEAQSGLHYNYFRDYEPGTGRYVASDPIGLRGGPATFEYSRSAPLVVYDSLGLLSIDPSCRTCNQYGDKEPKVESAARTACETVFMSITNISLAMCVYERCRSDGVIMCDGQKCKDNSWLGHYTPGSRLNEARTKWELDYHGEIFLCMRQDSTSPMWETKWHDVILHEFAHSCTWMHGMGQGVPFDKSWAFYD
ncbi:MAG: RHS repeat-associated core domain-containing protein [Xanthomonadales bacterium]|nr:RHS repeat-associated core domain-containing protein [Xanthomonadales bacterium]